MPGVEAATAWAIASWVVVGASTAYTVYKSLTAKNKEMSDASAGGLRANTRSTQEPLKIVYGKMRVGGNDVYMTTTGTSNNILWVVQTLAEGECDSIAQTTDSPPVNEVYLADKLYTEYGGNATYYFHSGSSSQAVDSNLNTAKGEWTDPLRNTCYIVFKLTYDGDYFQNLPARQVVLKGRKVTDFRDSPETVAWSDNPVLCLYDYMTHSRYGLGFSTTSFDLTSWTSAANYCDTKSWTLNMGIASDDQAWDVVNNILTHFRGTLIWYDGKFYLRYADLNYESSQMTITDAHLVQDESGRAQVTISEPTQFQRPDYLKVSFIDPDKGYVADEIPIGDDTGVGRELQLTGCTDRDQAAQLGVYNLERQQLDRRITGLFRDDCAKLEPHDVVTVTLSALSISNQLMRVVDVALNPDGLVSLTLIYENTVLYDDDYNLVTENIYTCTLPDPTAEPPAVSNVSWEEETYNYRLRTFSRLNIEFDPPTNYPWFKEVEVWRSFDDSNWEHMFNSTTDFSIDPVQEGQGIYIRLKTVSIFGTKSQDGTDYKIYKYIDGYTDTPTSLTDLQAIANQNSVNLYAAKVSDPDIEIYEFRLGSSWTGGIFLAALRSPNLSLTGVKPSGSSGHTFYANTLGNNGIYGGTPRSATVIIKDPPDGWTVQSTQTCDYDGIGSHANLITNGDMELDSDWSSYGTPTTQERSSEQSHSGTYSRKFTVDSTDEGIQSSLFTTTTGETYAVRLWVYPDDATSVHISVGEGDGAGTNYDNTHTGLTQDDWNLIEFSYTEASGGASARFYVRDHTEGSGTWYVDDVTLVTGSDTNTEHDTYDSDDVVKCSHTEGDLVGTYTSPIYDLGSSGRYLVYCLADIAVIGAGTTWGDVIPSPNTWDSINITTRTWTEIFELSAAPQVRMTLKYGDSTPPTSEVQKMEILSGIVTGRYFRMELEITDPSSEVSALIKDFSLKFLQ